MTVLGQINAGGRLTAAEVRDVAPNAAYKGASESVTSSTTLQNDDALYLQLDADSGYMFTCLLIYTTGTPGSSDMKAAFTIPSGASLVWSCVHYGTGGSLFLDTVSVSGQVLVMYGAGSTQRAVLVTGTVMTGGTSGQLQLEWAQDQSSATATTMEPGSFLAAWQVA